MRRDDLAAALHEEHAGRLFGIAYRILGSVAEAEDAVQETFVRWAAEDRDDIREPAAWLTTVVTRLCLDRLRSARHRRETYVGPWLPEPLATDDVDPADLAGTADSLTLAFLVVLESLSPLERVVFVLHDVFGHPHAEIAAMLDREPAAIRQLARRARIHLDERRHRYDPDRDRQREVTDAFLAACAGEDLTTMLSLLAPGVVFTGDGGGVVTAAGKPIEGAERVAKMLLGFLRTGRAMDATAEQVEVNHAPGLVVRARGELYSVLEFEVADGRIQAIRGIRNPEKLVRFGATSLPLGPAGPGSS